MCVPHLVVFSFQRAGEVSSPIYFQDSKLGGAKPSYSRSLFREWSEAVKENSAVQGELDGPMGQSATGAVAPNIEIEIALLPEVSGNGIDESRATPCFNDFNASASVARSGSLTRMCTCSGTQSRYVRRTRSSASSKVRLDLSVPKNGCR
jgi:hypothetical protein